MKHAYVQPSLNLISLLEEDILTASGLTLRNNSKGDDDCSDLTKLFKIS